MSKSSLVVRTKGGPPLDDELGADLIYYVLIGLCCRRASVSGAWGLSSMHNVGSGAWTMYLYDFACVGRNKE